MGNWNLLSLGDWYNQANRLITYNGVWQYVYDGNGLRVKKIGLGGTTNFTWEIGAGRPLLLTDGSANYIYGPGGQILEQIQGSTPSYYHTDQLGSIRALTDQAGAVVNTYAYDAYGTTTASSETLANPFRYAGEYQDAESGLYYLRARYYDPASQQFLTRDPLVASTEQAYNYAGGSPLNATDPLGLAKALPLDGGGSGGAAGVGIAVGLWYIAEATTHQVSVALQHYWDNTFSASAEVTPIPGKLPGWEDLPWKRKGQKPVDGKFFYDPPCDNPTEKTSRAPGGDGFIDREGNVWQPDRLHRNHWDVQLNKNLRRLFGRKYLNVNPDGTIRSDGPDPTAVPLPRHP